MTASKAGPWTSAAQFGDTGSIDDSTASGDLRWYRRHQMAAGALFWLPTIFLFLISRFGITTALQLQAVYYLAVVVVEVPSGWFSDRFGRVTTLRMVAVCWLAAHALLVADPGLVGIVVAQILLASGYALASGTDVTLHFETLEALGRADEYPEREAAVRRASLYAAAASAVIGGGLGMIDLRLPFAAASMAAALQLVVAFRLREPDPVGAAAPTASASGRDGGRDAGGRGRDGDGLVADLAGVVGRLREPVLAWVTVAVAAQVVVVHLAGELTPAYLTSALGTEPENPAGASLATGLVAAVVAAVAALTLHAIGPLDRRFGLRATMLIVAVVPVAILGTMALVSSVLVVPLLALRGVHGAANAVMVPAVVGGRVPSGQRATFLSVASLTGRLGYAGALGLLSLVAGSGLGSALAVGAVVAVGLWLLVALTAWLVPDFPSSIAHDHDHDHDATVHDHLHRHDDGHHDHDHDPPVVGPHRHEHRHRAQRHRHAHSSDVHHAHPHR